MLHTVTMPYQKINEYSVNILETLGGLSPHVAAMAVALSLIRLLRVGEEIEPDLEKQFTQDVLEWAEAWRSGEEGLN